MPLGDCREKLQGEAKLRSNPCPAGGLECCRRDMDGEEPEAGGQQS